MDRSKQIRRTALLGALLALVTMASFWPVRHHDFIRYDDPTYVRDNPHVTSGLTLDNLLWAFRTGHASNWHPVTWISHMLDAQVFGLDPGWHHFTNLLFHTANALLLFLLLKRLTDAPWRSWFVAALFALHPLHVESVAWIAERKDVLSMFFFILTLWAYSKYVELTREHTPESSTPPAGSKPGNPSSKKLWYCLALFLFALGLMSKPMLVTLPFLLLLLDLWPLKRFHLPPAKATAPQDHVNASAALNSPASAFSLQPLAFVDKLPFLLLSILSSVVTYLVQEKAHAVMANLPLLPRVENAVASYLKYIGKTFWPAKLAVFYPHPGTRLPVSEQWPTSVILISALLLLALSVFAVTRVRRQPWLATGWFWYLGMLVPVIGIVQVGGQAIADRYTYIPLIGLFICLVWGAAELLANRRLGPVALASLGILAVLACAAASRIQVAHWRNSLTLFEHALAVTKNNAVAHCNVGMEYGERGQYEVAVSHFQAAIAAAPANADPYFSLGLTYELQGKPQQAIEQYETASKVNPWDGLPHSRLGSVLWELGKRDEALQHFSEAARLNPDDPEVHLNLGTALSERNELVAATAHFTRAVQLKPNDRPALMKLGEALMNQRKLAEAERCFRQLLQLDPSNADNHINLGGVLWAAGKRQEALEHYGQAVQLKPDHALAHYNLATGLYSQNRFPEAATHFAEAARLKPDYVAAVTGVGRALAAQGKLDDAVATFQRALSIRPDPFTYYNLGLARAAQGRPEDAITNHQAALKLRPDWPPAMNELASILATHPQSQLRNGPEAVRLAERACELSGGQDPVFLATLDTAYAAAGRFPDAIRTAEKTRDTALSSGRKDLADAAESRLTLYRNQQPYLKNQPPLPR